MLPVLMFRPACSLRKTYLGAGYGGVLVLTRQQQQAS